MPSSFILKLFLVCILSLSLVLQSFPSRTFAEQILPTAGIALNGKMVDGMVPVRHNNLYYLPLKSLARLLGYNTIRYTSTTKTYSMTDGSEDIRVTIGGTRAVKGDNVLTINPPIWVSANSTAYISINAANVLFSTYIHFQPSNGSFQIQLPASSYKVQPGDTLWKIAYTYHTTVEALMSANNLRSEMLLVGQVLQIPGQSKIQGDQLGSVVQNPPVEVTPTIQERIIQESQKYLGVPYKFGATAADMPRFFDCSSYIQYVFAAHGITLPRSSRAQGNEGISVRESELKAGDLLFFTFPERYTDGRVGHVAIYMGDGKIIHATTRAGVAIHNFSGYWKTNFLYAKRVIK